MNPWFHDIRSGSWRARTEALLSLLPLTVGLVVVFIAPITGISFIVAGAALFGGQFVKRSPDIRVSFNLDGAPADELRLGGKVVQRIDKATIVELQTDIAFDSMPRAPAPPSGSIAAIARMPSLGSLAFDDVSDARLRKFVDKTHERGEALHAWLVRYEEVRNLSLRQFDLPFRIDNRGEGPAQNVRLRFQLPAGFDRISDLPSIDDPPSIPKFNSLGLAGFGPRVGMVRTEPFRPIFDAPLPEVIQGKAPAYSRVGGHIAVEYSLGDLNPCPDYVLTGDAHLRVPGPGTFEIEWELLTTNAGAQRGTLALRIEAPRESEPALNTLAKVLEDRELLDLES